MRTYGNAGSGGTYNAPLPDLPRADGRQPAHRPWCVDCKVKHDRDELDQDGRCEKCAAAAVRRAEAEARRDPAADAIWQQALAEFKGTGRRRAKPRRGPRTTSNDRVPGASTSTSPAGPTVVRRRVDNTRRIAKLEERQRRLRAELASVGRELVQLRREHGTETTYERRPTEGPRQSRRDKLDLPAGTIIDAYQAGATMAELAEAHGCTPPTIRRLLVEHDVPTRDKRVDYTPELVERVRTAYVDQQLSTVEAAALLEVSVKVITTALGLAGVELRPAVARNPGDMARGLKDRLAALGVTSREVKVWGVEHGHLTELRRGIPSAALVDAYAAAHQGPAPS